MGGGDGRPDDTPHFGGPHPETGAGRGGGRRGRGNPPVLATRMPTRGPPRPTVSAGRPQTRGGQDPDGSGEEPTRRRLFGLSRLFFEGVVTRGVRDQDHNEALPRRGWVVAAVVGGDGAGAGASLVTQRSHIVRVIFCRAFLSPAVPPLAGAGVGWAPVAVGGRAQGTAWSVSRRFTPPRTFADLAEEVRQICAAPLLACPPPLTSPADRWMVVDSCWSERWCAVVCHSTHRTPRGGRPPGLQAVSYSERRTSASRPQEGCSASSAPLPTRTRR